MAKAAPPEPKLPTIRLNGILAAARKDCHWTLAEAKYAELWYRRFLFLSLHHGRKPVYGISKKADCLWHTHILDTKRYRADCQRIFGHYLDHTPTHVGSKTLRDKKLADARALYMKTFGSAPPDMAIKCY
jgi:hypothetical protein